MARPQLFAIGATALLALSGCQRSSAEATPADFCAKLQPELGVLAGNSADPTEAQRMVDAFDRVEPATPTQIRDDWKTLRELFVTIAATDPKKDTAFGDAFAALLTNTARTASTNVALYIKDNCGIDMNAATGVPTQPSPTTTAKGK